MNLYFEYRVVINYRKEPQEKVDFPAVTICNMNRMKSEFEICIYDPSALEKCKPYQGDEIIEGPLVRPEKRNFYFCNSQLGRESYTKINSTTKFIEKYSELASQEREEYGHQLANLVEYCFFNGKSCNKNFHLLSSFQYGNCYTLNKLARLSLSAAETTQREISKGLELVLNAEITQYVPISQTVGFRIVIHDASEEPDPETKGININPGYETNILLRQTLTKRLPAPYKDHCVFYSNNKPFVGSQIQCMQVCIQEYNYVKCGCTETLLSPSLSGRRQCNMKNSTDVCCLDSVLSHLAIHGTNCECPLPCVSTYYNEISTRSMWPSKASFFQGKENATKEDWINYRASHAKINIFFSTLEKAMYEQFPLFDKSEIFSHLGGELGLWLGLSLAGLLESVELILCFANSIIFIPIKVLSI
ncbi:degenerin-like protein unc-105 [Trichonephila clavata]|uniref:Degenerin-like protein unc-105 n=1 Tax=Trichonephila clavata TaxID=2740835 RepID=A0A8X6J6E3_TRICU|nr:degenerin-like protein unc-105 [Trichonephila clavata]